MDTFKADQIKQQTPGSKKKVKTVVLAGLGTLALGTLAFFGIKKYKQSNQNENDNIDQTISDSHAPLPVQASAHAKPGTGIRAGHAGDAFPLKLGSKGAKVFELQRALIRAHGTAVLPKYGADGAFGTELANALKAKGYSVPLTEAQFKSITQSGAPPTKPLVAFDPAAIAKGLYTAMTAQDFETTQTLLKTIPNPTAYATVSEQFKSYRVAGGVRQTLVSAVFSRFPELSQRQRSIQAFLKMGLRQKNAATNTWSLTGLNGAKKPVVQLVTLRRCIAYKNGTGKKQGIVLPENTYIGDKIRSHNGITFFKLFDSGESYHVTSKCVREVKGRELTDTSSRTQEKLNSNET